MVARRVIDTVGLMDSRYFLYFEEVDYMFRIRAAGFEVWHEPNSCVVHIAGQSTGVRSGQMTVNPVSRHWLQSRWKFFSENYGVSRAILATILFLSGNLIYCVHRLVRLKTIENPPGLLRSYIRHGFSMPPARQAGP